MNREIKASEFKAKCLNLMDQVNRTGNSITVTKRGKPVVEIVPARAKPRSILGLMRGQIKITGDIVAPLDVEWEAMKE